MPAGVTRPVTRDVGKAAEPPGPCDSASQEERPLPWRLDGPETAFFSGV